MATVNVTSTTRQAIAALQKKLDGVGLVLGAEAVDFFTERFTVGRDVYGVPFRPRKKQDKRGGRAILVRSGRLRGATRIGKVGGGIVEIVNNTPYAEAHNEGYKGPAVSIKGRRRKGKGGRKGKRSAARVSIRRMNLPKRQFMGASPLLEARLLVELKDYLFG